MDAFLLARLAAELTRRWAGAQIQEAWVDRDGHLVLRLRGNGRTGYLLLSAAPRCPGIGLVEKRPPCPPRPPALAAYLRAHARGGRFVGAQCPPFERVVQLEFVRADEKMSVVLETTGRRPKLLALDAEGAVRVATRWDEPRAPHPRILPGQTYRLPPLPAGWTLPTDVTPRELGADPTSPRPADVGFPPGLHEEFLFRATVAGPSRAFVALRDTYGSPGPLYRYGDVLSAVELTGLGSPVAVEPDALGAAGQWLAAGRSPQPTGEQSTTRVVSRARRRLERRIHAMTADLEALGDPDDLRRRADILGAALHRVEKGDEVCVVPDLEDPSVTVEIHLDPRLSPSANLDRLYAKAKKAQRGRVILERRISEARAERDQEASADTASTPPPETAHPRSSEPYRRFTSSDGWPIWVGRNRIENDRLVRQARPWDLWFHTRDAGGAHVLVRKPGREGAVPERTRQEAAGLAARYSHQAHESRVDVMVVEAGRLRRPRGGKPGQVLVTGEQTIRVTPGAGHPRPTGAG